MTICYYQYFCDDDFGECFGFFTKTDKLVCVHWFAANDAQYRNEYMRGLFAHFGIQMERLPTRLEKAALKLLKKEWE